MVVARQVSLGVTTLPVLSHSNSRGRNRLFARNPALGTFTQAFDGPCAPNITLVGAATAIGGANTLSVAVNSTGRGTLFIESSPDAGATWPASLQVAVMPGQGLKGSFTLTGGHTHYRLRFWNGPSTEQGVSRVVAGAQPITDP